MSVRAVFHEEADARAVADRLRVAGFVSTVSRDRFAGEDDDEDHPWMVHTEAPAFMVEVVAEEYDGWLDATPLEASPAPSSPLDLPDGPRRIKGHFPES